MAKKPKPIANVTQSTAIYDLGVAPVMSEIRTRASLTDKETKLLCKEVGDLVFIPFLSNEDILNMQAH